MYDWPEVRWATDALWRAIAARLDAAGIAAPDDLDRSRPSRDVWRDPGLVLSQTCGWPYVTELRDAVQLVATPHYDVPGCSGALYSSAVVTRVNDPATLLSDLSGRRIAFNSADSLSGFVALRAALLDAGVDLGACRWVETGSHRASLRAVAEGRADAAAIDAVCRAFAAEYDHPTRAVLRKLVWTKRRSALPFITAAGRPAHDVDALRDTLADVLNDPDLEGACAALKLTGLSILSDADYCEAIGSLRI